jgi:hypothetical protein
MKITINGKSRTFNAERISYAQIVQLAFPKNPQRKLMRPSIDFTDADQKPDEGILNPLSSVKIKDGTKIRCINTSNA